MSHIKRSKKKLSFFFNTQLTRHSSLSPVLFYAKLLWSLTFCFNNMSTVTLYLYTFNLNMAHCCALLKLSLTDFILLECFTCIYIYIYIKSEFYFSDSAGVCACISMYVFVCVWMCVCACVCSTAKDDINVPIALSAFRDNCVQQVC